MSQVLGGPGLLSTDRSDQAVGSILVADCGSSFSRASLLERVETGYCFVAYAIAPTTAEPPWSDVSVGVRHVVEQLEDTVKRSLLDDTGSLIIPQTGVKGVDLFVVTCSAGQPLRVILTGLVSEVSLASLERAALGSYVEVLGVIARDYVGLPNSHQLKDALGTAGAPPSQHAQQSETIQRRASWSDEDKIGIIRQQSPDVVWVAGGTDGGSREPVRELVETVALACTLVDSPPQPAIVYAGNTQLRSEIVELIGQEVELQVIDNVRPTLDTENLATAQANFQAAYIQRKVQQLPGMGSLIGWSSAPVLSTAQAISFLVMYLERLYESGKGVLCADVGSANTVIAASIPSDVKMPAARAAGNGRGVQQVLQVASDTGVGYSAPALLERVGLTAVARWLPFEPEQGEVEQVLFNKGVRPTTIPHNRRELLIEQAAAREALRLVMGQARETWRAGASSGRRWLMPFLEPIIISGGVLVEAPRPSQAILMMLDAIEPVGITTVLLDRHGAASALGAVAVTQALAAVQALDAGAFLNLGTVVAPVGRARPGDVILRAKIAFERGGELEVEAKYGSLEVIPLHNGEKATIELKPRRGFQVGRVGGAIEVNGGAVGLIIDARGRPLRLPSNLHSCHQLMQQWLWEMGAG